MKTTSLAPRPAAAPGGADEAEDMMRIGEVARLFDVTLRTLRFYEDKGLIHPVRDGTARLYSHRDRAKLKLILLGRKIGFSLRDVKQMMDLYDPSGANVRQFKVALEKAEKQMARLQKQRALIDEAIADLARSMDDARRRLEASPARTENRRPGALPNAGQPGQVSA